MPYIHYFRVSCLAIFATFAAIRADAHLNCGHPDQRACDDGWSLSRDISPPKNPVESTTESPSRDISSPSTCGTSSAPTQSAYASKSDMKAFCAHGEAWDGDPTNACANFEKHGTLPASATAEPASSCSQEASSTTEIQQATIGGTSPNSSVWGYGDRWEQAVDPNSPGRINFAANGTLVVNQNGKFGDKYDPVSVNGDTMTFTANKIGNDPALRSYINQTAANQGQNPSNVKWTGAFISDKKNEVNAGDSVSFQARMAPGSDVTGAGAGVWLYTSDASKCANCEIDIFDKVGQQGVVQTHVHNGSQLGDMTWPTNPEQWNTYGLTRSDDGGSVTTTLNGKQQKTFSTPGFDVPMHTIISLAGNSFGETPTDKIQLQVKDLRYSKPGA